MIKIMLNLSLAKCELKSITEPTRKAVKDIALPLNKALLVELVL